MKRVLIFSIFASLLSYQTAARAVELAVGGYGLALGNEPRIRGLRLNLRDHQVHRVDGINLQLGLPNYAGNNPRWLRLLPLVNLHL